MALAKKVGSSVPTATGLKRCGSRSCKILFLSNVTHNPLHGPRKKLNTGSTCLRRIWAVVSSARSFLAFSSSITFSATSS